MRPAIARMALALLSPPALLLGEADGAPGGQRTEALSGVATPPAGESVRIPFDLPVSIGNEGLFTALVRATTDDGSPLFEGGRIDESRWRIWLDNPEQVRLEVRGGRLNIHAEGSIGYNGLVSLNPAETRDVEAACLAGVESGPVAAHPALLHLCGQSHTSPDNWFEVRLQRGGGGLPGAPGAGKLPMVLYDAENAPLSNREITLRLYTEDGSTLVAEAHPGDDLGYATLSLEHAPWEIYPAGALLRIFFGQRQLGGDLPIPSSGVEGFYPDDVWLLTLEEAG